MFKKSYLILFLLIFILVFIVLAADILLPFLMGIIIAYILKPIVSKLNNFGFNHLISVLIALFFSLVVFFGSFIFLVPVFIDQFQIILEKIPIIFGKLNTLLNNYNDRMDIGDEETYSKYISNIISSKSGELLKYLFEFFTLSLNKTFALLNFIGLILITPIVTFYILYDWEKITIFFKKQFFPVFTKNIQNKLDNIDSILASFFRGQLIVSVCLVFYYSFALLLLEMEGAISIGVLIGILSFLPYLGTIVGFLISFSFSIFQYGSLDLITLVLLVFILGQFIESYFLSPKFVSKSVGLHPLYCMFVIIASGAAFGFIGILLAIPLSAIIFSFISDFKK